AVGLRGPDERAALNREIVVFPGEAAACVFDELAGRISVNQRGEGLAGLVPVSLALLADAIAKPDLIRGRLVRQILQGQLERIGGRGPPGPVPLPGPQGGGRSVLSVW